MNWIYLLSAIVLEVFGTISLRASEGLVRRGPALLVILFYGLSFAAFAQALRRIEIAVAYAVFTALGTALMAAIGVVWFKEPVGALKVVALTMIIVGVMFLSMTAAPVRVK